MNQIVIDFSPSLHGHFLEYMVNRYIFNSTAVKELFEETGASDIIEKDPQYQESPVHCDHYSEFDIEYPHNTRYIIYVKHNKKYDFISLVNSFYRCFDRSNVEKSTPEDILAFHIKNLEANSERDMRNRLYTKLYKRYFDELGSKRETALPTYEFDFGAFFSLGKFVAELRKVAEFLGETLTFNQSLVADWEKFIEVNQGYQYLQIANHLLESIIKGREEAIKDNVFIHAYLNCHLSHAFPINLINEHTT